MCSVLGLLWFGCQKQCKWLTGKTRLWKWKDIIFSWRRQIPFTHHSLSLSLLHCALASGAVYCNRSCLFVCVCVFVTGGRAGGVQTASARAVFASLWALFSLQMNPFDGNRRAQTFTLTEFAPRQDATPGANWSFDMVEPCRWKSGFKTDGPSTNVPRRTTSTTSRRLSRLSAAIDT